MVKSLETGWGQGTLHVLHGWVDGLMDGQIDTAQNIPTKGFKKIHNSKKQPPSNNKYQNYSKCNFLCTKLENCHS